MVHWGTSKVQKPEKILNYEITVRLVHKELYPPPHHPQKSELYIYTQLVSIV